MSNFSGEFHNKFDSLRRVFRANKKVGEFFSGLAALHAYISSDEARDALGKHAALMARTAADEYNLQAGKVIAAVGADKFAACAEKYGFPVAL